MCISMEDATTICDLNIEFKIPENTKLSKVVLAPSNKELALSIKDNIANISMPRLDGYGLIKMIYQ